MDQRTPRAHDFRLPVEGRYENEGRCNRVLGALSKLSRAAGTLEITVLAGMGVVYWGFRSRDPAENRRPAGHPGIATDAAKAFAVDRTNGERPRASRIAARARRRRR
jgi:hypothetical protein